MAYTSKEWWLRVQSFRYLSFLTLVAVSMVAVYSDEYGWTVVTSATLRSYSSTMCSLAIQSKPDRLTDHVPTVIETLLTTPSLPSRKL